MEIKNVIDRINYLYHKSREQQLSMEEIQEQKELRRYYIDLMKNNLRNQLETMVMPQTQKPEC